MAYKKQTGLLIRYGTLVFDLSGVHSERLLARVREALNIGLEQAINGISLQRMLATLTIVSVKQPVKFFTNAQEWIPGVKTPSYPAVTTWLPTKQPASVDEIRATRSDVRIFFNDFDDVLAGTLETTWHELLHPTVPFTHPQDGLPPDTVVDYPRWLKEIYAIKAEMPRYVVDPITRDQQSTDFQWSANKPYCIHCAGLV